MPVVWSIIAHAEKIKHQCSSAVSVNLDLTSNQSLRDGVLLVVGKATRPYTEPISTAQGLSDVDAV
jgi:hypothetical protein